MFFVVVYFRSYDLAKFYADKHPEKGTVGKLQLTWYDHKFLDYANALKHVLNTGKQASSLYRGTNSRL